MNQADLAELWRLVREYSAAAAHAQLVLLDEGSACLSRAVWLLGEKSAQINRFAAQFERAEVTEVIQDPDAHARELDRVPT